MLIGNTKMGVRMWQSRMSIGGSKAKFVFG